ncbi:MAG: CbbQ/NirQ/NorQ C-terminal domain-containing protein, partial [Candidatus Micrarchaeia archaeon]
YLDEIVEARKDTIVAIHSLTDYRRVLYLDRTGEVIEAPDDFMLIAAYNPNYQSFAKSLKPSTKQRFVAIEFGWPSVDDETEIIMKETGVDRATAKRLAELAANLRESKAETPAMEEVASTRTLVYAARLIAEEGVKPKEAALNAIANIIKADGITDDEKTGIDDIIEGSFK